MAVTAVNVRREGWTATKTPGDIGTYTAELYVDVDDTADGPNVVLGSSLVPQENTVYGIGNDFNDFAIVTKRTPRKLSGTRWVVTVEYGSRSSSSTKSDKPPNVDENDNPVDNPLDKRAIYKVRSRHVTRILDRAVYRGRAEEGLFFGTITNEVSIGDHRAVGEFGPIVNSAIVPFDPPLEFEYSQRIVTVERPAEVWNEDFYEPFQNSVNKTSISIPALNLVIPPYMGKLVTIDGTELDNNGTIFYQENYELLIDKYYGWYLDVLDRGYSARAREDDIDEDGNTIQGNAISLQHSLIRRLKDQNGAPVTEPQLLDGDGQPLPQNGIPVYLRYDPPKVTDWGPLQLDSRVRVF